MLEKYSLGLPSHVYAGVGALDELSVILKKEGVAKVALFTDKGIEKSGLAKLVTDRIEESGVQYCLIDDIPAEPSYVQVEAILDAYKSHKGDFILALGGGSVMDTAKLISILGTGDNTIKDLLKDPSRGKKTVKTLMIPTTSGTGSEATCNAIVLVPEDEVKVGIVNASMMADYVILDPAMTASLPQKIAASTGLDALCHAIECYTGTKANPFSDIFALKALQLVFSSIVKACKEKDAVQEKTNMLLAAFYGGAAIASSGTTAVHALSYPLGGKYHIPHGISNAMLLVPVMKFNAPSCLQRFASIYDSCIEAGSSLSEKEKADEVIRKLEQIVTILDIPSSLKDFGISEEEIPSLARAAVDVKRLMVNNPREMSQEEAEAIYREVM